MRYRSCLSLVVLLLLLPACRRSAAPEVTNPTVSGVLGTANFDLNATEATTLSSQTLVPGLEFNLITSTILNGNGVRVRQLTLEVQNNSSHDFNNLTLYSVQTPNTLPGSNVSNLRDALGNTITDPAMAQSIVPVHGQSSMGIIDPELADMQAFSPDDQIARQTLLDTTYPERDFAPLARGFVASHISGQQHRAIAAGETGMVTLAVQYPFDANKPAGYPDTFKLSFAFVDETITRFSQGANETNEAFLDRLAGYGIDTTNTEVEIVPHDPDNPPAAATLVMATPLSVPLERAPTASQVFTLRVVGLLVEGDMDVEVRIADVGRVLVWE